MNDIKLNARLESAVPFVRDGADFADVGTDHAYLPIFLAECGKINNAVASDINEGPLMRAKDNIEKYGLSEKIETVLCDGLSGIGKFEPTDIAIFGMGGELIVKIIDEAPWVKNEDIRLILQPMTHPEKLREYLFSEGFKIVDEVLSKDRGRIYQTLCVNYDGVRRKCGGAELLLGEHIMKHGGKLFSELVSTYKKITEKKIRGKENGTDISLSEDRDLLEKLCRILAKEGENNES